MQTWIVLSPHFDDAVLSVPVWMSEKVRAGDRVVVATIFSAGDQSQTTIRESEDDLALRILGCESVRLGFLDAPFRTPPRDTFCEIVFGEIGDEKSLELEVRSQIIELKNRYLDAVVVAPLACGTHIDHRIVFEASIGQAEFFYEDRPYGFVEGAVDYRLVQLGCREPMGATELEGFLELYFQAGYVTSYLDPLQIDEVKIQLRANNANLARRQGAESPSKTGKKFELNWLSQSCSEAQVELAGSAVRAYTSQLLDLFPTGLDTFFDSLNYRETVWRPASVTGSELV